MEKYKKIFGSWYELMLPFLESEEFKKIGREIQAEKETVYPDLKYIFRAFKLCPLDDLKIVILTTNVFEEEMDGLAFSCGWEHLGLYKKPLQTIIFDAIENDVANGLYLDRNPNLKRWATQGILLLNTDLTVVKGKPGSHIKLWRPFIKYVVDKINETQVGIIFTMIGNEAMKYEPLINKERLDYLCIEHPYKAIKEKREWRHNGMFSYLNRVTNYFTGKEIQWV